MTQARAIVLDAPSTLSVKASDKAHPRVFGDPQCLKTMTDWQA